jgi:hypothetical protein
MRRLFLLAVLLLTGCRTTTGPFAPRDPERVDDPRLPISEQERRGRDRLSYQEIEPNVLPRTYSELPGPHSR